METQPNHPRQGVAAAAGVASKPRRRFAGALTAAIGRALAKTASSPLARSAPNRLHLQNCRIAGSQYHDCDVVLSRLRIGDALQLHRQPDNPHDEHAIEVFWRKHKLGYLPHPDNAAAALQADRAHGLHAEIIGIDDPDEMWEPVRLRVWVLPT